MSSASRIEHLIEQLKKVETNQAVPSHSPMVEYFSRIINPKIENSGNAENLSGPVAGQEFKQFLTGAGIALVSAGLIAIYYNQETIKKELTQRYQLISNWLANSE